MIPIIICTSFIEDILKRSNAIWPSPDGNKLVYATFNDTEVQQVRWKVYEDTSDGNLDPYPKEKTMYYPKVREYLYQNHHSI